MYEWNFYQLSSIWALRVCLEFAVGSYRLEMM